MSSFTASAGHSVSRQSLPRDRPDANKSLQREVGDVASHMLHLNHIVLEKH